MPVQWMMDGSEIQYADRQLSMRGKVIVLHMQVETLGKTGWDWNIWERSGRVQQRYGLAGTLDEAKASAEGALGGLARELVLAV